MRLRLAGIMLLALVIAGAGCGPSNPKAKVWGKVTYQGKLVTAGNVAFYGPNNQIATSAISSDGTYTMEQAPVGDVKIAVSTPSKKDPNPMQGMPKGMMMDPSKMGKESGAEKGSPTSGAPSSSSVEVPPNLRDPESSGLSWKVPTGGGEHNIDIP